jgi:L-lactate dehydrogenase
MHKASSLSELGFNAGTASSGFFRPVADDSPPTPSAAHRRLTKVSVIGAGNVGMAIAQTILTQNLADEIALVDALPDKLRGEALDLQHAAAFLPRVRIVSSGGRRKELEGGHTSKKIFLRLPNCEKRLPNKQYIKQTRP